MGRTKDPGNKQRILLVAGDVFLEHGFGTSLDVIAEAAGVTKPTIYSHFGSKAGLLNAMIEQQAETRAAALEKILQTTDEPEQDLRRFAQLFVERVLSSESRPWQRFAAAESRENPEVGQAFYRAGPMRVQRSLATYLKRQTQRGVLRVEDPDVVAELFIASLLGMDMIATQIGKQPANLAKRTRRMQLAIRNFMAVYGVDTVMSNSSTGNFRGETDE